MIKVIIDILQKNQIHTFGKNSHSCVANEENQSGKTEDNISRGGGTVFTQGGPE